ncbi:MAG: phosphoribosylanthranilate isomerase [Sphingobacteriales bacterium SCN 48-20]|jgi:phosphoribosylanthranilate isomerase|nr:phosphoribosylanthranilate isomerase [Terrimonas ferruginea]ODT93361.1 MAG: phosphoribosylanthranilate isomerase [Sphingobacteriales bacterium SCN 48-20]OJW41631.1 MAG: phosphoribosylanthranilate isomerase [Sphingobacteriales bacterium 48-107]
MRIKVCGMTLPEQVNALAEMGADLAGFIFYPKSPRFVGNKLSPEKMKKIGGGIGKVGVFVNTPYEELLQTVESYRLDIVQLHGDETPIFCEKVANYVTVIKAFRLSDNDPLEWMVRPFHDASDMYMFDTLGAGYGGTGKKFDWKVLSDAVIDKLFLLSGGIEPGDEEKLKAFAKEEAARKLFALDINSKFEFSPGVKDMDRVKKFIQEMKA